MSRTVLLAVSLLKMGLWWAMSEIEPSTRWPPLTTFCVVVVVPPPPQAARSSMPPARKAVKAKAPPIPRRTSRRDQSCRKRSNCSDSRSELLLLLTYILQRGDRPPVSCGLWSPPPCLTSPHPLRSRFESPDARRCGDQIAQTVV